MHNRIETENLIFNDTIEYPNLKIDSHVVFFRGPSGCGKSTLMRILNRTTSNYTGAVKFNGESTSEIDPLELRKKISYVGQSVYLFDETVKENFKKFYEYSEREIPCDEKIMEMLNLCCIDVDLNTVCTTLSGGEKQRVFISIYLSQTPDVLILDEPTSAMDDELSAKIMKNIIKYTKDKNITLLVISHNSSIVEEFAETIIELEGSS